MKANRLMSKFDKAKENVIAYILKVSLQFKKNLKTGDKYVMWYALIIGNIS